ncbi:hypothetical protein D3C87_1263810 [compost metagenome]
METTIQIQSSRKINRFSFQIGHCCIDTGSIFSICNPYIRRVGIDDVGIIHELLFIGILISLTVPYIKTNISQKTVVDPVIDPITNRKIIGPIAQ